MTDFDRIQDLFMQAVRLPESQRDPFLDDACADDDDLRLQIDAMLAQDIDPLLADPDEDSPAGAVLLAGVVGRDAPALPESIGGYRIISVIGEGGMGVVYEAEQADPKRRVALKVIRADVVTTELLARFRQEASVLAHLRHPGIAQIYDAGTDDTGGGARPWFAMELIEGPSLLDFIREQRLSVPARLELVARIADAVGHAHQKSVIHRDLKPTNILIEERQPDSGYESSVTVGNQPRILDFGIARVTDADLQTVTLRTDIGQLVGTLPYMSPEQASGDPTQIDTRSDVYALAVIAFEALTGRLPYDIHGRPVHDAVRTIVEQEPTRLGTLDRSLRGDIETIVGKGLEKDRARRYQSAAEFGADIRRHLGQEPISARPPSLTYQVGRLVVRNRVAAAFAAALVLALIAGTITSVVFALRAGERATEATVAMERAADEASKAEAINTFLTERLLSAEIIGARGRSTPFGDIVDEAVEGVRDAFTDRPAVRAGVLGSLGLVYQSINEGTTALPLYEESLTLLEEHYGPASDEATRARFEMAIAALDAGDIDRTATLLQETIVAIDDGALADDAVLPYEIRVLEGELLFLQREYVPSLNRFQALYDELLHARVDEEVWSSTLYWMGVHTLGKDGPEAALPFFRANVESNTQQFGARHLLTASAIATLGDILQRAERLDEADQSIRVALEIQRERAGDDAFGAAVSLLSLARLSDRRGMHEKARDQGLEARRIMALHVDEHAPSIMTTDQVIAFAAIQAGDAAATHRHATSALKIARMHYPEAAFEVAVGRGYMAYAYLMQNRLPEAEAEARAAVAAMMMISPNGAKEEMIVRAAKALVDVLERTGQDDEAADLRVRHGLEG